jgi:glycosyltransferase involved in cell wall biosynthesis
LAGVAPGDRERGQAWSDGSFHSLSELQANWLPPRVALDLASSAGSSTAGECGHAAVSQNLAVEAPTGEQGKPRICHLLEGAAVAEAEALASRLVRQFRSDYHFILVSLGEPGSLIRELQHEGVPVHVIGRKPGLDWKCSRSLVRVLRSEKVNLVHAHQSGAFYFGLIARSFYRNPPILLTEHERRYPDNFSPKRVVVNRMFLESRDRIVAASLSVRQTLLLNEGLPSEQVDVIYHGELGPAVDAACDRDAVRREIGVEADALLILQPAPFDPCQNHTVAIRALAQVVRSVPTARLALVGAGPEERMIRALVDRWGLVSHVLFLGPRTDNGRLLAAADLVLLTGTCEGALSILIQALAAERPVVATRVGGVPEVVEDRNCGLIACPGDYRALAKSIRRLGASPAMRKQFGERGRERAEAMFSGASTSLGYSAMYSRMLAR